MATKRTSKKEPRGRGSAEAIEKRRTARQLNTLLSGGLGLGKKLDGRTEKRRRRLLKELKSGKGGTALKPIDFVSHVSELLEIGETLASIKKQGVKPRRSRQDPEVVAVARRTQQAHGFRPEAWRMLGIRVDAKPGKRK